MLTTENIGSGHPDWIPNRGKFTQVLVLHNDLIENNRYVQIPIAQFFGLEAKRNAQSFVQKKKTMVQ